MLCAAAPTCVWMISASGPGAISSVFLRRACLAAVSSDGQRVSNSCALCMTVEYFSGRFTGRSWQSVVAMNELAA